MKNSIVSPILLSFIFFAAGCRNKENVITQLTQDAMIRKWQKSVVNIECKKARYTSESINDIIDREKLEGKISTQEEEFARRTVLGREANAISGTALYLADSGKKYLVTAKHVIFDQQESSGSLWLRLYKDISVRTPYDYFLQKKVNNASIPWTSYSSANPFYLSDDNFDIGIISLQASATAFMINTLEQDGYTPLELTDIDTLNNLDAGENIAAIGFPDFSQIGYFEKINEYQSNVVVLPVSTFGSIAMSHPNLPYFISDITIYPGNSGGPIIKQNKLIGIVSAQIPTPVSSIENNKVSTTSLYSRGSLAKVIKAKYIISGLRKLQEQEADKSFH